MGCCDRSFGVDEGGAAFVHVPVGLLFVVQQNEGPREFSEMGFIGIAGDAGLSYGTDAATLEDEGIFG